MTNDLTKMGNEELLDAWYLALKESQSLESNDDGERAIELRAELLRRLAGLAILPKAQAALNLCCRALGDECRTQDWSISGAESYKAYMQADDIVDEIEEFLDPELPQPPKKG